MLVLPCAAQVSRLPAVKISQFTHTATCKLQVAVTRKQARSLGAGCLTLSTSSLDMQIWPALITAAAQIHKRAHKHTLAHSGNLSVGGLFAHAESINVRAQRVAGRHARRFRQERRSTSVSVLLLLLQVHLCATRL